MAPNQPERLPDRVGKTIAVNVGAFHKVEFSRHALDRMEQRGVTENQIIETLRNPVKRGLPTATSMKRYRGAGSVESFVDVTFDELPDRIRVITVMVIPKPKKPRRRKRK